MSTPAITPFNGTDGTGGDSSILSLAASIEAGNAGEKADGSNDGLEFVVYNGGCGLGIGIHGARMADDSWSRFLLFWSREEKVGAILDMAELDVRRRCIISGTRHSPRFDP